MSWANGTASSFRVCQKTPLPFAFWKLPLGSVPPRRFVVAEKNSLSFDAAKSRIEP
jgi:hypothetical protein